MSVITITRQVGSWGDYIGVNVAKTLNFRYTDRQIIIEAVEKEGITEGVLERMERMGYAKSMEDQKGLFRRIIDSLLGTSRVPAISCQDLRYSELCSLVTSDDRVQTLMREGFTYTDAAKHILTMEFPEAREGLDYHGLMKDVVTEFAQAGNAVVVVRGSQMILKDWPSVLHVLVIAPVETRIKAIMEQEGVSRIVAERRVKENDEARAAFFENNFNVNWLDPILYDLVINTGRISKDPAVELIVKTAQNFS
ncbi:MAG: cytidylate kinase-like family protein [Nitrospirota bacterium]